jgi:hypothetical protein
MAVAVGSGVLRVVPAWQQLLCEELEPSENSPGPRRLEVVSIQVEEVLFLCGTLWKTFCFCTIVIILERLPSLNIKEFFSDEVKGTVSPDIRFYLVVCKINKVLSFLLNYLWYTITIGCLAPILKGF